MSAVPFGRPEQFPVCPICGKDVQFEDCSGCGGDGFTLDAQEDCNECGGNGAFPWCPEHGVVHNYVFRKLIVLDGGKL